MAESASKGKVGIVGSGLIGRSWAMLFAGAGYNVVLYDILDSQIDAALSDIKTQLKRLEDDKMLRGQLNSDQQFELIKGSSAFEDAIKGAIYIQECIPEKLEMKVEMFKKIDDLVNDEAVIASSTSCILPSKFTDGLSHKTQCIVAHPINPPYYVPLVELVPAPWTSAETVAKAKDMQTQCGQKPVVFKKEIDGFAINRLQYTLLNECVRLVQDEVMTVEDIDKVMAYGLGHRYAFLGVLETALLNAEGLPNYCDRYGETIVRVSNSYGDTPSWASNDSTIQEIQRQFDSVGLDVDGLPDRRAWRDGRLAALAKLKINLEDKDKAQD